MAASEFANHWCLALLLLTATPLLVTSQQPEPTPRQLCQPGTQPPPNRFNSTERLRLLRGKMQSEQSRPDWYLETGLNRMLSSPQQSERFRYWISGFAGSSGQVLITQTEAYLFTDTRYTLQADQELDCAWKFYDSVNISYWLSLYRGTGAKLAVDARQIRASEYTRYTNPLLTMLPLEKNLIDELWTQGRPQPIPQQIYPLNLTFTGTTWQVKVEQTREAMSRDGAQFLAVTGLDETAYLLNLRATVLANVPYFPSMVLLSSTGMFIFLDNSSTILGNETLRRHFNLTSDGSCESGVTICPTVHSLVNVRDVVREFVNVSSTVWLDDTACSYSMFSAFSNFTMIRRATPVQAAKAVKNAAEQEAFTKCSLMDSAALVAFLSQFQKQMVRGDQMTELSASELLTTYRAKLPDFRGLSFETIAASGPNAAVIHYRPSADTNRAITKSEAFLLDSGGQYLGCTTDVTRTLYYGSEPPAEVIEAYTRVLMGVIDLFNLTWPSRLPTIEIDAFARHNLWAVGKTYGHGTGHGIGLFLGVHEAPNGIGRTVKLTEGNFQSIEPGFYQREAPGVLGFGIRLETISGVKSFESEFLRFQPVTWVPFERKLMKVGMLSPDQLRWLNWYHAECRKLLSSALNEIGEFEATEAWLVAATEPIVAEVKAATALRAAAPVAAAAWAAVLMVLVRHG